MQVFGPALPPQLPVNAAIFLSGSSTPISKTTESKRSQRQSPEYSKQDFVDEEADKRLPFGWKAFSAHVKSDEFLRKFNNVFSSTSVHPTTISETANSSSHTLSTNLRFHTLLSKQEISPGYVIIYDSPLFNVTLHEIQFIRSALSSSFDDLQPRSNSNSRDDKSHTDTPQLNRPIVSIANSGEFWFACLFLLQLVERPASQNTTKLLREIGNHLFKQLLLTPFEIKSFDDLIPSFREEIKRNPQLQNCIDRLQEKHQLRNNAIIRKRFPLATVEPQGTYYDVSDDIYQFLLIVALKSVATYNIWNAKIIGYGIYEYISSLNISSDPAIANCFLLFENNGVAYLHAYRNIPQNSEIIVFGQCQFEHSVSTSLFSTSLLSDASLSTSSTNIVEKEWKQTLLDETNNKFNWKEALSHWIGRCQHIEKIYYREGYNADKIGVAKQRIINILQWILQHYEKHFSNQKDMIHVWEVVRLRMFLFCLEFDGTQHQLNTLLQKGENLKTDHESKQDQILSFVDSTSTHSRFLHQYACLLPDYVQHQYLIFSRMIEPVQYLFPYYHDLLYLPHTGFLDLYKRLSDLLFSDDPLLSEETAHESIPKRLFE
jgi:hypothetical protein